MLVLFFRIRVRQCSIQLLSCPDNIARIPVVLNILKYISSFPPIWLTALWITHPNIVNMILVSATINSIYSFLVSIYGFCIFVAKASVVGYNNGLGLYLDSSHRSHTLPSAPVTSSVGVCRVLLCESDLQIQLGF